MDAEPIRDGPRRNDRQTIATFLDPVRGRGFLLGPSPASNGHHALARRRGADFGRPAEITGVIGHVAQAWEESHPGNGPALICATPQRASGWANSDGLGHKRGLTVAAFLRRGPSVARMSSPSSP